MRRLDRSLARAGLAPTSAVEGAAWVEAIVHPPAPSRLVVDEVSFAPGSRTAWHTHPYGQLILVTEGAGWIQVQRQPALNIYKGDAIWIEPGEKHWHGATPDSTLRQVSIQEHRDGSGAKLYEHLSATAYPPQNTTEE